MSMMREAFTARDEQFIQRIESSFSKQTIMATIGAQLVRVVPGQVTIALPVAAHISQQHGFVHAGIVATIADSAAGYAGLSLMPKGAGVLTTEFKINLIAPANGEKLIAEGRVIKAGRTLTIAMTEVFNEVKGQRKLCALLTATLMTMEGRDGISD
jgi:uncharacterized protein (TIGR00369 family)